MLPTWVPMGANTVADAMHKRFSVNLGPRAGSARQWKLFNDHRHRISSLATGVSCPSIFTRFSVPRTRAPLHLLGSNVRNLHFISLLLIVF